jgi:hypothetical protein
LFLREPANVVASSVGDRGLKIGKAYPLLDHVTVEPPRRNMSVDE